MLDKGLAKHASEFFRDLVGHKYEKTETGLFFPKSKVTAHGVYTHTVNGADERSDSNLITNEGLMHILSVVLYTTSKISAWYVVPYAANYTPLAGLTAASFPSTASEITSGSEGYSESTRVLYQPDAPASEAITNTTNKANMTIITASSLAVNGLALSSVATKGATTGVLLSATKLSATRTLYNGDIFGAQYQVALTSV